MHRALAKCLWTRRALVVPQPASPSGQTTLHAAKVGQHCLVCLVCWNMPTDSTYPRQEEQAGALPQRASLHVSLR